MKNMRKITALTLALGLMSLSSLSNADIALKKFNTNENILVNNKVAMIKEGPVQKEEELRATWVSTVYNLDFPSKPGLSKEDFQKEYLELLDNVEALKLNSIIFQVRPKGDAFYDSKINPWSDFLTGVEDKSPQWDPLKWMVDETHKRGLEFQAWFNPYRVTTSYSANTSKEEDLAKLSPRNYARRNPQNVFKYNGKLYLNPAEPEVISYINETIMEVVYKYDIDGVHLDDYFYPSRRENIEGFYSWEEAESFKKYGQGHSSVSSWRRDNVTSLIARLSSSIRDYNKNNDDAVSFGVSPFGIWGHKVNHPKGAPEGEGSNTPQGSMESYKYQFVDTRKWIKEGLLDYVAPQIYWTFDQKAAPYGELVSWWADQVAGTDVDLYIGHANYRKAENKQKNSWANPREISNQIKYNNNFEEVKGSIFFRYKSLLKGDNPVNNKFLDILRTEHYSKLAKLPSRSGDRADYPKTVYDLKMESDLFGNILTWKDHKDNKSAYYIIYRKEVGSPSKEAIGKIHRMERQNYQYFVDQNADPYKKYVYSVSSLDKANRESPELSL